MKLQNETILKIIFGSFFVLSFCYSDLSQAAKHNKNRSHKQRHSSKHTAPASQVDEIVTKLLADIDERPIAVRTDTSDKLVIEADPNKSSWLQQIYAKNLVEASKFTALLSDKLLQRRIFEHFLAENSDHFLLHTIGLKEFLLKYQLVDPDGELIPDTDNFEEALAQEFPYGFIVRPALGVAPLERNHGLFAKNDDFLKEIFRPHNSLYIASTLHQKIKSHIIHAVASGEAIILQEDFVNTYQSKQKLKQKVYERIRLHSFEDRIVKSATPDLWVLKRNFEVGDEQIKNVENFAQAFLDKLPKTLTARQAWGIDVALLDNGEIKILDVVTNRGIKSFWSSYLDEPKILGAYTRHIQDNFNIDFRGFSGFLFRSNLANYANYWQLKRERSSQIASSGILSSMPPWPF